VSPVTGRLDAFQWTTPVASLPSPDKAATIETSPFEEAMLAAPAPRREIAASDGLAEPPRKSEPAAISQSPDSSPAEEKPEDSAAEKAAEPVATPLLTEPAAVASAPISAASSSPAAESQGATAPTPLFRTRADLSKPAMPAPAVIPIVRAPDDPGIDDEAPADEFVEQIGTPKAQAGGWRGFLTRWGA
jgi:HemY protein